MVDAWLRDVKEKLAMLEHPQQMLARKARANQATISLMLNGQTTPRLVYALRISKALGIQLDRYTGMQDPKRIDVRRATTKAIRTLDEIYENSKMSYKHYETLYKAIRDIGGWELSVHEGERI